MDRHYRKDFLAAIVVITSIIGLGIIIFNFQSGASKIGHLILGVSLSVIPYVIYRAIENFFNSPIKKIKQ